VSASALADVRVSNKGQVCSTCEMDITAPDGTTFTAKIADSIVDRGAPLGPGTEVTRTGTRVLPTGAEAATGYMVVEAEGMEAAVKLLEHCPIITSVRVHQAMQMPAWRGRSTTMALAAAAAHRRSPRVRLEYGRPKRLVGFGGSLDLHGSRRVDLMAGGFTVAQPSEALIRRLFEVYRSSDRSAAAGLFAEEAVFRYPDPGPLYEDHRGTTGSSASGPSRIGPRAIGGDSGGKGARALWP
jgi:hypothetical protein